MLDAFLTKVIAALEGIKMAEMAGMTNVVLETDALLKFALANFYGTTLLLSKIIKN